MNFSPTQKEKMLFQDQKKHEEVCVQKYKSYAQSAQDPQLKQLFNSLSQKEQQHLNSINQLLSGQVPQLQGQAQQGQQTMSSALQGSNNSHDAGLLNDMLMTEKYVSGTYDTAIFESQDANVRQVLNHIQKEEQQHGEEIFNYMKNSGMYNPQ
ncbi:MAG: spore coat protein [Bacillota bacterium]|nr:spore coat protein [Bacillota bacterium]